MPKRRRDRPKKIAPTELQYTMLERIELVAHVQEAIDRVFGHAGQGLLGPGLSAATFTPPAIDPLDAQRAAANTALEQQRDPIAATGLSRADG